MTAEDIGHSLAHVIAESAARHPDRNAFEDARSDRAITYGGLAIAVALHRDLLDRHEVDPGRPVLLTVRDPLLLAVVFLATVAAGRHAVAASPETPPEALQRLADRLGGSRLQIRDDALLPQAATTVVEVSAAALLESVAAAAPDQTTSEPGSRGAGASVLFTSGSTGEPKGVVLPEKQLLFVARQVVANLGLTARDRGFNPLPLFHVNAQVVGLLATVVAGSTLVVDARFRRTGFWPLLAERGITWLNAVPAILAVLARSGEIELPSSLRLIRSASAPLPGPVRDAFASVPLAVSWGMTEAASQITATDPAGSVAPGVVGTPRGAEVEVRGADGTRLPDGERGELWIRGPGVIDGYLGGAAADRFDADGWLRTGDAGTILADGQVHVAGRLDDVINRGGELVDPAAIESVLLREPRLREVAVVGRPDDVLGEVPVAYAIAAEGNHDPAVLRDALLTLATASLPRHQRPVDVIVVEDLPRSPAGKVLRRLVLAANP